MKVKTFRVPRALVATLAQGRTVLRGSWWLLQRRRWVAFVITTFAIILTALLLPHDGAWLGQLHSSDFSRTRFAVQAGSFLGTWGDYPTYNFPLSAILWILAWLANSHTWRRIAVICFLGGTLAGLFDDCFRLTLGRPRPDAHVPDGFYGLNNAFHSRFQSFPSGHAAAVFGTAFALLIAKPWLGGLTTIFALLVVWARMEIYRHYPSDVAIGSLIGMSIGLLIGLGAKAHFYRPERTLSP